MNIEVQEIQVDKYPAYKDSGVEWLGEIPEHWEVKKIKYLFNIGRGRVIAQTELIDEGKYPVYSSQTLNNGILGFIETYDYDCDQVTWTTDGANAGTVFLRKGKYNCTNVCGTLHPKSKEQVIEYIVYSLQISAQFYKRPDTNGAKIMNAEMAEIFVTLPSVKEQTAIAHFLDDRTTKIDNAISIKERQIELLKERKQILIHKAVTQGLDENVPLKDSGVEWIGKIPEHWEITPLKHMYIKSFGGGTPSTENIEYWNGGISWVSSIDVKVSFLNKTLRYISELGFKKSSSNIAPKGSIVIVTRSGILQHTLPISILMKDMAINQDIKCFILKENEIDAKYLLYFVQGNNNEVLVTTRQQGATVESINLEDFANMKIPVPSLQEQKEISVFIEAASKKIEGAVSLKLKEVEKLKEYKSSLINSAVTGKIKVTSLEKYKTILEA